MTFGDEIQAPAPKRRKAGKKGKAVQQEEDAEGGVAAAGTSPSGSDAVASEPAELTRTGAAEVVADADATIPSSQGGMTHADSQTVLCPSCAPVRHVGLVGLCG